MANMPTLFFYLPFLLLFTLVAIYAERKIAAFIQDRLGPMDVGYQGWLQTLADMIKLLQKEIIIPAAADKKLFLLAPIWTLTMVLAAFAVLPVTSHWSGAPTHMGVLYSLAMVSLKVLGILVAGWASHNKYARLGALRAVAQMISYEVPLVLSILCVLVISQTLDLQVISFQQGIWQQLVQPAPQTSYFLGLPGLTINQWGGIFAWNIFRMPVLLLAYGIFFIASLAASNRTPFDLVEAESELVGGYYTEYSGLLWAWFMLAEYGMMLLMSLLGVMLFLGSWNTPFPNLGFLQLALWTSGHPGTWLGSLWAAFWLFTKAMVIIFLQMWLKWTLPRLRVDQLMRLCWVYLIPIALGLLVITVWWQLLIL
jgi:NADH-quinone oxidoreductase subunit H